MNGCPNFAFPPLLCIARSPIVFGHLTASAPAGIVAPFIGNAARYIGSSFKAAGPPLSGRSATYLEMYLKKAEGQNKNVLPYRYLRQEPWSRRRNVRVLRVFDM